MILMAVSDDHTFDLFSVGDKIAEIRNNYVNAKHLIVGEAHSAVYDHDLIIIFQEGHVLSDLIESSYGDYFEDRLPVIF